MNADDEPTEVNFPCPQCGKDWFSCHCSPIDEVDEAVILGLACRLYDGKHQMPRTDKPIDW